MKRKPLVIPPSPLPSPPGGGAAPGFGDGKLFTRREMAAALHVSVRLLDEMRMAGELPAVLIRGRLVRFYWPDVLRKLKGE